MHRTRIPDVMETTRGYYTNAECKIDAHFDENEHAIWFLEQITHHTIFISNAHVFHESRV